MENNTKTAAIEPSNSAQTASLDQKKQAEDILIVEEQGRKSALTTPRRDREKSGLARTSYTKRHVPRHHTSPAPLPAIDKPPQSMVIMFFFCPVHETRVPYFAMAEQRKKQLSELHPNPPPLDSPNRSVLIEIGDSISPPFFLTCNKLLLSNS